MGGGVVTIRQAPLEIKPGVSNGVNKQKARPNTQVGVENVGKLAKTLENCGKIARNL